MGNYVMHTSAALRGISVTTEVVTPVRLVATRIVRLEHKVISILA